MPKSEFRPAINPWVVALTVTLATFMELLDTSIANVSLLYIGGGLGHSYDEATWILTTYLVANAAILAAGAAVSHLFFETGVEASTEVDRKFEGTILHKEYLDVKDYLHVPLIP
jgi:hypothetical protein